MQARSRMHEYLASSSHLGSPNDGSLRSAMAILQPFKAPFAVQSKRQEKRHSPCKREQPDAMGALQAPHSLSEHIECRYNHPARLHMA